MSGVRDQIFRPALRCQPSARRQIGDTGSRLRGVIGLFLINIIHERHREALLTGDKPVDYR